MGRTPVEKQETLGSLHDIAVPVTPEVGRTTVALVRGTEVRLADALALASHSLEIPLPQVGHHARTCGRASGRCQES